MNSLRSCRSLPGWFVGSIAGSMLAVGLVLAVSPLPTSTALSLREVPPGFLSPGAPRADDGYLAAADGEYVVLAWNDLGMHCYNSDFQYLAVLPPYNTLWAQVIRKGDPPQIVTTGITVTYGFPDNTYSVGKSNFWDYDQDLFGVDLAPNVGLTGKGMSGTLDSNGTYFVAEGIPLTEYRDSDYEANPSSPPRYPYQLATVTVWDRITGEKLAETIAVAPVSTEMHCDNCHYDGGIEDIATGSVELNILTLHDEENIEKYPPDHAGSLVSRAPILCAECHASNALGAPGVTGVPNFSKAMHDQHQERVTQDLDGCYQCHPGPKTLCLRDVMSQRGMDCIDCHGPMSVVKENPNPWLNEPRCDNTGCHDSGAYDQDQALYRKSRGHGGLYCEGCHDSTHAVAPSREANDGRKFLTLQGVNKAIGDDDHCTVCHATLPTAAGPHGITASLVRAFTFEPDHVSAQEPGATVLYTHTLRNMGNVSDTYDIAWTSSQGWATVTVTQDGGTVALPVTLLPNGMVLAEVRVTVPSAESVRGLADRTVVTATSLLETGLRDSVTDVTLVPRAYVFLPLVMRRY